MKLLQWYHHGHGEWIYPLLSYFMALRYSASVHSFSAVVSSLTHQFLFFDCNCCYPFFSFLFFLLPMSAPYFDLLVFFKSTYFYNCKWCNSSFIQSILKKGWNYYFFLLHVAVLLYLCQAVMWPCGLEASHWYHKKHSISVALKEH